MTRRMKRRAAPRSWTVSRKGTKWIRRPSPGPHAQEDSIPLVLVLRDVQRLVHNAREARILTRSGSVLVDGKVVHDLARGLGLMDTLSLGSPLNAYYRIVKDPHNRLRLVSIPSDEAGIKLARVRFKHSIRGGQVEVTLHDGRNILVAPDSPYRVGDTLKLEVPAQKVVRHVPLAPGQLAYVSGGTHVGELAHVDRVEVRNSSQSNLVHFKEGFSTVKEHVFVVGETTPLVTLTEALRQ